MADHEAKIKKKKTKKTTYAHRQAKSFYKS